MKRSLVASSEGIKRAKVALKRQSLTQKALAEEFAIASWTTVSKFFNGKPVDRHLFLEICERLDLDWQDIAAPFLAEEQEEKEISAEISPELAAIQRNSLCARVALDPYILPRINRQDLLKDCLTAIRRGVVEQKRRVVPILGAAGYGKSTILGSIYDELVQAGTAWVGLVRCNDLIETAETFAPEIGEKLSGVKESIVEIAVRLHSQHGRGVLLIDTLDLVLEKRLVPVLRNILLRLLECGTTVVFTCRDADFRDFFEPYHESFAGFHESIERCQVPNFNTEEVREAARAFCQIELKQTPAGATNFAQKIVSLSTDSKSLADITCNPLLLALLCKLFGEDGNVPEDLTVSQLYQMYWDLRIAISRKPRADSRRIGMAKKNLCLGLAALMYHASEERLRDFVYETQLELDEVEFLAYEELFSDGVLQELGADRVSFFHQTFLEYAIARYFVSTPEGEIHKQQILNHLQQQQNAYAQYFIWSVIRQLLNLVNVEEFHHIANSLEIEKLSPFRTLVFASVSRIEPESANVLLKLLPHALQLGDAYQEILLVAAAGAPNRHIETVWLVVLELLRETQQTLINKAAEVAGELLARVPTPNINPMEQALTAVINRDVQANSNTNDIGTKAFGTLMKNYIKTPKIWQKGVDENVLNSLKASYFSFGGNARAYVLQLYCMPDIPMALQKEILMLIITQPVSEIGKEKENAIELLQRLLPDLIASGNSIFGNSWLEALYAQLPKGWDVIQATAVGHQAVHQPELLAVLINKLLQKNYSPDDTQHLRRHYIAVTEAIKTGASSSVASILLDKSLIDIPNNRLSTISSMIREIVNQADKT
ncbi:NACHT domain-containing protein [Nostoc sp.]|uniref:NACHT domain-containing protein n=1 Tax=Nostoc sp. TaxID=1180 RepID=UPI002FF0DFC6